MSRRQAAFGRCDTIWDRVEAAPPLAKAAALTAMLALVLAANAESGPTFAFGGLYALSACSAAWLLGFRFAVFLGGLALLGSTILNGIGGPYGGPAMESSGAGAMIAVGLRIVSLASAAGLIARVRDRYDNVRERADLDPLTGIANHGAFCADVAAATARAARGGTAILLAYLDLDDFKALNDRLGHAAGVVTLRAVADAARRSLRAGDKVGRLGGDEFALLVEARDETEAEVALDRIRRALGEAMPTAFSMGAVVARPRHADVDLIAEADRLMYRSKREAKGTLTMVRLDTGEAQRLAA